MRGDEGGGALGLAGRGDPRAAETLYRAARCAEAARLPERARPAWSRRPPGQRWSTLNYADEALLFELNSMAGPEAVKAYCKTLHDKADALVDGGVKTLSLCLARASVNGSFGGAARYCEEQLQRRAPLAFPPLQELFAAGQALDPDGETIPVQAQPYDFVELTSGPAPLPAAPH